MAERKKTTAKKVVNVKKEKAPMNRNVVYILYAIGIVLCVGLAQFFMLRDVNESVLSSVDYEQQASVNYRVFYEKNQFYDEAYLGKNETYVSSLVDEIEVDFIYYTFSSDYLNSRYEYDVKAKLVVFEPGDKTNIYWQKEYELDKIEEVVNTSEKEYRVNKSITIDFEEYQDIYNDYKVESRLSSDAILYVTFNIRNAAKYPGLDEFKYNAVLGVDIPISENTFKINENNKIVLGKQTVTKTEKDNLDKVYSMIIGGLLWLLGIVLSAFFILTYNIDVKKEGAYARKLKKILNTYDNIIVDVDKLPALTGLSVVNVTSFEELVDAQCEVRLPINFKEDKKKKVSKFILVRNNLAWVYTLKEGDEGEKK